MNDRHAESAPTATRYVVFFWLCLAATLAYLPRNCLGVAEKDISADVGLSPREMGLVLGIFYFTYAVFQVPSGWLGYRWGSRLALPFFGVIASALTALPALLSTFPGFLLSRLGLGAAQAGLLPCTTNSVARWLPLARRSFATGALTSFMSIGGILATGLTGWLLAYLDWRWVLVLYALPGIVWAVWFYLWFRERPEEHSSVNAAELAIIRGPVAVPETPPKEEPREPVPWLAILASRKMWWICGQQFCRAAGYAFFGTWFVKYLYQTRGVLTEHAGFLTMLPILGVVIGATHGGIISDSLLKRTASRQWSRKGLAVMSGLGCALMASAAYFMEDPLAAVALISGGAYVGSFANPCAYSISIDMGARHVPTVFAVMNMTGNLGATAFSLAVPEVVYWTGGWDQVIFLYAGVYATSSLFWLLLDPEGTVFD